MFWPILISLNHRNNQTIKQTIEKIFNKITKDFVSLLNINHSYQNLTEKLNSILNNQILFVFIHFNQTKFVFFC